LNYSTERDSFSLNNIVSDLNNSRGCLNILSTLDSIPENKKISYSLPNCLLLIFDSQQYNAKKIICFYNAEKLVAAACR